MYTAVVHEVRELVVPGTPRSLQAKGASLLACRIEWQRLNVVALENASVRLSEWLDAATRGEGPPEFVHIRVTTELALEKLP